MDAALAESSGYIIRRVGEKRIKMCSIGLVLGSGLGSFADSLKDSIEIDYKDIPHYPHSTVIGHAGKLVVGHLLNYKHSYIVTMKGRKHYYECADMSQVTFPIYCFKALGLKAVFLTNAAGGINEQFNVGDFMVIRDHINLLPNPCHSSNLASFAERQVDMTDAYDQEFRECVITAAQEQKIDLQEGVYLSTTGPSFETPAEIRVFRSWGADCVGMSTTGEVIVARHCGLRCVGLSCITNLAAGVVQGTKVSSEEVFETGAARKYEFSKLMGLSLVKIHDILRPTIFSDEKV